MLRLSVLVVLFLVLVGCSNENTTLQLNEKTKLTAELIKSSNECKKFSDALSSAANDEKIDQVYQEAMKAHCIKSDI